MDKDSNLGNENSDLMETEMGSSPSKIRKEGENTYFSDSYGEHRYPDLGQSSGHGVIQDVVVPVPVNATYNDADFEERNNKTLQVQPDTCFQTESFYEAGHAIVEHGNLSSSDIDFGQLNEISEVLAQNQSKTKDILLQEFLSSCPKRYQKVKDFLSFYRHNTHELREEIYTFLELSGEDKVNSVGSERLKTELEKASCYPLIKLLVGVVKNMETKLGSVDNDNSVTDVPCIPVVLDNVQPADIANEVRMEEDPNSDEVIEAVPLVSSSSSQPSNGVNVDYTNTWRENITDHLFSTLQSETRSVLLTTEQKISKMGKVLFTALFSEQEVLGGFARTKKNIQAYDCNRVFEISQIINFMLTTQNQPNVFFLETFRSGQCENKGLAPDQYKLFWANVMIKFASDERKRIKKERT